MHKLYTCGLHYLNLHLPETGISFVIQNSIFLKMNLAVAGFKFTFTKVKTNTYI